MAGILPKVRCESCGRSIAVVATGLPRSHRNSDGADCPGSGNASGSCPVCGRVTPLERNGKVRPHKEMRVRRSKRRSPDGLLVVEPETYTTKTDCPGGGQMPEVSNVVP